VRRFGVWIALVLLISYLQFVGGGWFGIYTSSLRITSTILLLAIFLAWAAVAWRKPASRPRSRLTLAIVLAIGSMAVSTVFSRQPRLSVEYLAYAIVLTALYLLLVQLLRDPFLRTRLASLTVILGVVPAVAFLAAVVSRWFQWWDLVGRLTFPPLRPAFESFLYGNPSSVMAVVVMFLPPALVVVLGSAPGRARVVIAALLTLVAAAVTLASGSRAGWLAIAFSLLVIVIAVAAGAETRRRVVDAARRVVSSRAGLVSVGVLATATVVVALAFGPGVLRRAFEGGENLRGGFVSSSLRMFSESPIVGTGPGTWVAQRIEYVQPPEIDYYIPHAHNIYAQTLAELGLVGAAAGVVLIYVILSLVVGAIRGGDPARARWGWAALAVCAYFAAHSTLDFFMNMPALLLPLAFPVAWLDASASEERASQAAATSRRVNLGWLAGAAALAVALVLLLRLEGPAYANQVAVDAAYEGRWSAALEPARQAAAGDPDIPTYHYTLGLALSRSGDHESAATEFRRVALSDDFPEAWLNLAAELAGLGRRDEALEAINRALRLGYQRSAVLMPAGELALRLGETELAERSFATAMATLPSLAADPWWHSSVARGEVFPKAVQDAVEQAIPEAKWQIALLAGDPERALTLVDAARDPDVARLAIAAWAGDANASQAMFNECHATPLSLDPLAWCGRLAGRDLDPVTAFRYRAWADYIIAGSDESGSLVSVATTDKPGRWMSGGPAYFWGYYTYRRPIPWDLLVPTLVHLRSQ
jgi:O-antigen ligase